jgi:hypothetical protein
VAGSVPGLLRSLCAGRDGQRQQQRRQENFHAANLTRGAWE